MSVRYDIDDAKRFSFVPKTSFRDTECAGISESPISNVRLVLELRVEETATTCAEQL